MKEKNNKKFEKKQILDFVERINSLLNDKEALSEDISSVYKDATSAGYDSKILRKVVKAYRMDADDLSEQIELLRIYQNALGGAVQLTLF